MDTKPEPAADQHPDRLTGHRGGDDEKDRDQQQPLLVDVVEAIEDRGQRQADDHQAQDQPEPAEESAEESHGPSGHTRRCRAEHEDDVEDGHGQPSRSRAWVKNPVWATIRWSGRTA